MRSATAQVPKLRTFANDEASGIESADQIAEVFRTPLVGHYTWDYQLQDDRIRRLYELGKKLNWNTSLDIDWNVPAAEPERTPEINNLHTYAPYLDLSTQQVEEYWLHSRAWTLSQFLHGEQGALLVASQLISCAPSNNAKLYAASQAFDEARHVEALSRYMKERVGFMYPVNPNLKAILDKILSDPRWDLKFIGMQLIIEGLALAAFPIIRQYTSDPVLKQLIYLMTRDEARHVAFGINYLESFVRSLSNEEKEDRALFAYEACVISRERLFALELFEHFGWDPEATREHVLAGPGFAQFRDFLFARILPNLRRIGLLTPSIRQKFEALGIAQYADWPDDAEIDWAELAKPLS